MYTVQSRSWLTIFHQQLDFKQLQKRLSRLAQHVACPQSGDEEWRWHEPPSERIDQKLLLSSPEASRCWWWYCPHQSGPQKRFPIPLSEKSPAGLSLCASPLQMQWVGSHSHLEDCSKDLDPLPSASVLESEIHVVHKGFPGVHQGLQSLLLLWAHPPGNKKEYHLRKRHQSILEIVNNALDIFGYKQAKTGSFLHAKDNTIFVFSLFLIIWSIININNSLMSFLFNFGLLE